MRSLAVTFVGPATPQVPISFEVEVLREGKAVSTLLGRAVQEGQVVTLVQGSFGDGRPSAIEVKAQPAVDMKPLEQSAAELPYIKGVTPEFMRHVALRWAIGGLPFSGNDDRRMGGWVRLRDMADGPASEAHLLAMVDAWPPSLLPHLRQPAAGSTLTRRSSSFSQRPSCRPWTGVVTVSRPSTPAMAMGTLRPPCGQPRTS